MSISTGAVLQLNSGANFADLVDNGSLILGASGTVTYAGNISGPGNVIQDGTGTTILSGRNTYSGGARSSPGHAARE